MLAEIPVAPMVDMVFLLLAYFMITSSLQEPEHALHFRLPVAIKAPQPVATPDPLIAVLSDDGQVQINQFQVDQWQGVRQLPGLKAFLIKTSELERAARQTPSLWLAPEAGVPHQAIVATMDAAHQAGFRKIGFKPLLGPSP
jgi:biopolymer transport protein ExbD